MADSSPEPSPRSSASGLPPSVDDDAPQSEYSAFESSVTGSPRRSTASENYSAFSPAPSVLSLTDSLYASSYRKVCKGCCPRSISVQPNNHSQVHDRLVNSYSDLYVLPADQEEMSRLG